MADYRVIKKEDDKFYTEIRKKLFWHSIKASASEKEAGIKPVFDSFKDARNFVFVKIKNDKDK